jgi:hypothetical protein
MSMWTDRFAIPMLLGLGLVVLTAFAPETTVAAREAQTPALDPAAARVWFLRPSSSPNGNVEAAAPELFANGSAVGNIPAGSEFYRDFAPGTYRFTVQPYGLPTGQAYTVQLAAGTQTYLEVQWVSSWEEGYPEAGWGFAPNTFAVLPMSPQLAQAYLPSLTYRGQR